LISNFNSLNCLVVWQINLYRKISFMLKVHNKTSPHSVLWGWSLLLYDPLYYAGLYKRYMCCLSFFVLRILVTPFVSSNSFREDNSSHRYLTKTLKVCKQSICTLRIYVVIHFCYRICFFRVKGYMWRFFFIVCAYLYCN
jgi:hypothetical protein